MKKILFILSALFVVACSTDDSSSAPIVEPEKEELSFWDTLDTNSYTDYEFVYNYESLRILYLRAKEELKGPEEYYSLKSNLDTEFGNTYEMYESLSSSYTYYIPPEVAPFYFAENFLPDAEVSIGVEVNEKMIVTSVYKNSSAANAGILRGDSVIAIDGNPVVNKGAFDKLASGEEGDELSLTVYRSGIEITVKLNFAKVVLPTVFLDSVENIPKIRITGFEQNLTANEFREALELTKGATSTIIDLRGNPGGNIDELLNVAELFLNKGDTILFVDYTDYEEGSDSQLLLRDLITASETGLGADRYYVFLVNSNTASCSEYLLAAVTANKKSPLIGSPTYGKGIGVYVMETNLHGISSIESMLFYDKFGETFHAKGFVPDYAATNEVEIFNKALEFIEVRQQREAGYGVYNNSKFLKKSYTKSFEKIGAYKWIK